MMRNDEEDIDDAADEIAIAPPNVVNLGPPATPVGREAHGQAVPARRASAKAAAPPVMRAAMASRAAEALAAVGASGLGKIGTPSPAFAPQRLGGGASKLDSVVGLGEVVGDADHEARLASFRHADNGDDAGTKLALGVVN
jgi:hypothetical protein